MRDLILTDVSEVRTASIIRTVMMEAVHTSEASVNINLATRRYIAEDSKLLVYVFSPSLLLSFLTLYVSCQSTVKI
jgi:hypothetical protein